MSSPAQTDTPNGNGNGDASVMSDGHPPTSKEQSGSNSGFRDLAHRAIHPIHHDDDDDEDKPGHERPALERAPESLHISKQMPDSAFSRKKREEMASIQHKRDGGKASDPEDEGGRTEPNGHAKGNEDRQEDLERAGQMMRNAFGLQDGEAERKGEAVREKQQKEKEMRDKAASEAERLPHSLEEAKQRKAGEGPDHDPEPTFAEKEQARYLREDEPLARQPDQTGKDWEEESPDEAEDVNERRKRKNEVGQFPPALEGSKAMAKPGPRNEINLKPRTPHMHFHSANGWEITTKANNIPLDISEDGETERLPNGKIFRGPPDPEDKLTNTREEENKRVEEGDYTGEPKYSAAKGKVDRSKEAANGHGDAAGVSGSKLVAQRAVAGSAPAERIPKADHSPRKPEEQIPRGATLQSANSSPTSRPKTKRLFSSFRNEDGSMPGRTPKKQTSADTGIPEDDEGMQGAMDAERRLPEAEPSVGQKKWNVIRQKMLRSTTGSGPIQHSSPAQIPVTTELLAGQLPVMILKTWIDRDEKGHRAVPILLGNMRFRVGDSAGFGDDEIQQSGREVFRIECEYGDGIVKWVIYRELRDFISLHGHYKADNFGNRVQHLRGARRVEIPEFPKTGIPYLSLLRKKGGKGMSEKGGGESDHETSDHDNRGGNKADRSKQARAALQKYLVDLIRAVMFRPESERLCRFFELSAMTLLLAPRGGFQSKAGFLKIIAANAGKRASQPGLLPTSWKQSREPKWWIVRESYFVATNGPDSDEIYEVFMIDSDFEIERPKRVLRRGLNKLTGHGSFKALAKNQMDEQDTGASTAQKDHQAKIAAEAGSGQALDNDGEKTHQAAIMDGDSRDASQHTFYINNSQQRLRLVAKNVRQMQQFIIAMERVAQQTIWSGPNRFYSYAPIRVNCAAQWLVDGRDYFWNLSRAINMAKHTIYIHDWWLSPELYLRRPGNERYRLDNLLKRKAEDGVKIFIIIYNEVSSRTTPVDSNYTKKRLVGLHPNVMVQRSPSHFQTGTFYWSHHEKLCVIDETIAFMGGLDLCYGRWDTSQHILVDDDFEAGTLGEKGPIWPGKDMANERVVEFYALNKPFEDMFDRKKVPRMPWHDVGLQLVGQPARDLCRHFVQRWNLLMRTKNHSRPMPLLLPPADYTELELSNLGIQGTCEVQICRSVGPWSMGTPTRIEHSIQHAYLKAIQLSEHFVYIENQFFITSTFVDGNAIENRIGDALVDRIIRAHQNKTPWRACIVIPLLPGYTFPIDTAEASSVRLILECQNRTISRGTRSIYSRLRKHGIDPEDYISFFSLRGWGKFKSGALCTEQVYIHGKTMVVDDRLVICGSANINERSQRGDRDSELVAVIRDTDMVDGKMAGKPFKVGRFAHTLRMRLMREHLGIDVDAIEEDQLLDRRPLAPEDEIQKWDPDHEQNEGETSRGVTTVKRRRARDRMMGTAENAISSVTKGMSENAISNIKKGANVFVKPFAMANQAKDSVKSEANKKADREDPEREDYSDEGEPERGFASSVMPTMEERTIVERRPSQRHANGKPLFDAIDEGEGQGENDIEEAVVPKTATPKDKPIPVDQDESGKGGSSSAAKVRPSDGTEKYGAPANALNNDDDVPNHDTGRSEHTDLEKDAIKARKTLRKHLAASVGVSPWTMPTPTPKVDPEGFVDPLCETFWKDTWVASAVHNTEIFRKVFRCIPDDLVTTWAAYKAFANHAEKFNKVPKDVAPQGQSEPTKVVHDGPGTHGAGGGGSGGGVVGQKGADASTDNARHNDIVDGHPRDPSSDDGDAARDRSFSNASKESGKTPLSGGGVNRKPSGADEAWHEWEKQEMEELLHEIRGHLVVYPNRFLEAEDLADNFLFNSDKILPLPIYD